ncbi:Uncharacterised protein [Serratia quinivorans]|nr:Uncharacterised protein [Serratia quinivorans]
MIKRFNPDFSLSISHELAYMRETPEGGYVAHGDYATLFSELEVVKADRDALAVENAELKSAVIAKAYIDFIKSNGWNAGAKTINGKFAGFMDPEVDFGSMVFAHAKKLIDAVETPATSAALAAIEARFCGLLDTYGKGEPERFNPEFADLYAKIVNRIFSSVMDNPSVTDLESLTDWLENSAENARAYADMSIKFHAELREAK